MTTLGPLFSGMQALASGILGASPYRVVIQTLQETTDERGGTHQIYADRSPVVELPCLFDSENGKEIVVAGKVESVTAYPFKLPAVWAASAVVVRDEYRLRLLALSPFPERIFRVAHVGDKMGMLIPVLAVLVESDNA